MRWEIGGLVVVGMLFVACGNESTPSSAQVEEEVSALTDRYFELGDEGRYEEAFQLYHEASGVADGHLIPSMDAHVRDNVLPFLRDLENAAFDLTGYRVIPLGTAAAVVVGSYTFSASRDGTPISNPETAFTWALEKRDGQWVIRHWHTSMP